MEAARDGRTKPTLADEFAARLGRMYRGWAQRRGMRMRELEEAGGDGKQPYRLLLAVSGFGAYSILEPDDGLHVLEVMDRGKVAQRNRVHVRICPQPDEPAGPRLADERTHALQALAAGDRGNLTIVRRYREKPAPLVRDSVREWRSGLLDRVLAGDFDVIG